MLLRFVLLSSLTFCLLLLGVPDSAHAQVNVKLGAKAGANFGTFGGGDVAIFTFDPTFSGEDMEENPRPGLLVGGVAILDVNGPLSIQTELNYVQKGQVIDFTYVPPATQGLQVSRFIRSRPGTVTFKTSYLEIPALARYEFAPDGTEGIYPHVYAGPTFGFTLSSQIETELEEETVDTQDLTSQTNEREYGLTIGVGAELDLTGARALVDARVGIGLSHVFRNALNPHKHRSLSLTFGLLF
jgi:hypothetical protein